MESKEQKGFDKMAFIEKQQYNDANDMYFVRIGQGDTMANQICVAVNRIVRRWFNDGDVFDNTSGFGDSQDEHLADCANWLAQHLPNKVRMELAQVKYVQDYEEYEEILQGLCDICLNEEFLDRYDAYPADGDIFNCKGEFEVVFWEDEEDENW